MLCDDHALHIGARMHDASAELRVAQGLRGVPLGVFSGRDVLPGLDPGATDDVVTNRFDVGPSLRRLGKGDADNIFLAELTYYLTP